MKLYKNWPQNPSKGEVFTNIVLVNCILDKIPNEVWENSKSTFCDLSMGKGTFLIEIVNRLVYIYGYNEEDAKSRVFGYDIRFKYVGHLKRRGYKNVFFKDSLIEEFDMKFDVVLGNPPYQDNSSNSDAGKLYIQFTKKSLEIVKENGIVSFVTPETLIRDGRNKFNIRDIHGLKYVNHTTNDYFNVGVNIISWLIDKKYDGLVEVINRDGTIDYRNKLKPLVDKTEVIGVNLFEKLKEQKSKLFIIDQSGDKWVETNLEGYYPVNKNVNKNKISYTKVLPKLYNKRKLVISMSSSYKRELVCISNEDFGELHVMIDIDNYTDKQVKNLQDFLFNPLCVKICDKYKKLYKKGFNSMLYLFPEINIDKKYTNDDVKLLFGLTDDEVEYLMK